MRSMHSAVSILAASLAVGRSSGVHFRSIKWNLRPSPPRPEGAATEEQKNITLSGRRGKKTRRQRQRCKKNG